MGLEDIVGQLVSGIESDQDSVRLILSDGTWIRIFNRLHFDGDRLQDIHSKSIVSATQTASTVELRFEGGRRLSVGLEDEDYRGPEAMVLREPGGALVVWN